METAALSTITALDGRFFVDLQPYLFRWPLLTLFLKWVLDAYIVKFVPIVLVIVGFWFARRADRERIRHLLLQVVLTGLGALFIARLLALTLAFRERPYADPDLHRAVPLDAGLRNWSSFPSDHAVMAFAQGHPHA